MCRSFFCGGGGGGDLLVNCQWNTQSIGELELFPTSQVVCTICTTWIERSIIASAKGVEVMCSPCKYVCWFVVVEGPNLWMKRVRWSADVLAGGKSSRDVWRPNGFDLAHPRAEIWPKMCFLLLGLPRPESWAYSAEIWTSIGGKPYQHAVIIWKLLILNCGNYCDLKSKFIKNPFPMLRDREIWLHWTSVYT